jgi:hypothetical protein
MELAITTIQLTMSKVIWPRFLKNAYRKEPITSFILVVGAVDMVIGGVGQRWTLLSFGVMVAAIAILARWLQIHKGRTLPREGKARYYLPERSSGIPLPVLGQENQPSAKDF